MVTKDIERQMFFGLLGKVTPLTDADGNVVKTTLKDGVKVNIYQLIRPFNYSGWYQHAYATEDGRGVTFTQSGTSDWGNTLNTGYPAWVKGNIYYISIKSRTTNTLLVTTYNSTLYCPVRTELGLSAKVELCSAVSSSTPQTRFGCGGEIEARDFMGIDLTTMFADSGVSVPTTVDAFNKMFYILDSEGTQQPIGYIPYSDTAQKCMAYNGHLYKLDS